MTKRELLGVLGVGAVIGAGLSLGIQQLFPSMSSPGSEAARARSSGDSPTSSGSDEAWRAANANLAETVSRTEQKLAKNETEKRALEHELKQAKAKLATEKNGGAPVREEYDLTQDDWKELAKRGTVKARYQCNFDPQWHIAPEQVASLGLSPQEVVVIEKAVKDDEARLAKVILAGCAKVLGDAALAQKLGATVCTSVINTSMTDPNPDLRLVANIRAGNVPMPKLDTLDPLASMLLAETASAQSLQADLAGSLGPTEAHRITFAEELGSCSGTSGPP